MTKRIRIENADTTGHVVHVQQQDKQADGSWKDIGGVLLRHPTEMLELHVHAGCRFVVSEWVEEPTGNPTETDPGTQA